MHLIVPFYMFIYAYMLLSIFIYTYIDVFWLAFESCPILIAAQLGACRRKESIDQTLNRYKLNKHHMMFKEKILNNGFKLSNSFFGGEGEGISPLECIPKGGGSMILSTSTKYPD